MLRRVDAAWAALVALGALCPVAHAEEPGSSRPFGKIRALTSPNAAREVSEAVVQVTDRARAIELGLVPITATRATFRGAWAELLLLAEQPGVVGLEWSPGRRLFLDETASNVGLAGARQDFGVDGSGVIVGVVDTGIDVFHPAFLRPDGTTRVRWLLAYDESPRGVHRAVEDAFNCSSEYDPCAVYDAADINAALLLGATAGRQQVPEDTYGHGTHVAGIAAGSGETYPGLAPAADLVIVKGATGVALPDARILEGTRFVFDRAAELRAAAVVNLSLGSGFGAHDGTSQLELSLSELAMGPGRIIVTAAGNDGSVYESLDGEPFPVGSHTEVTVPEQARVGMTLFESLEDPAGTERGIFVWLAFAAEDDVQVGLRNRRLNLIEPAPWGTAVEKSSGEVGDQGDYLVYVGNGNDAGLNAGLTGNNAVVVVVGKWPEDTDFEIVLTGRGTARAWIDGFADGEFSSFFGRARIGGTIGIPAASPDLIAVGASVNRESWIDYTGAEITSSLGAVGTRADFSGAGPNQLGQFKPDILAPGASVVSAMSAGADPRDPDNVLTQFAAQGACIEPDVECLVVDDEHAVSSGTSMAAPVVVGAVALLLQRDPELDQRGVRDLLRAGAAPLSELDRPAFSGPGILDLPTLFRSQDALASQVQALPTEKSRLMFADAFLLPDPTWPIEGLLLLKDAEGLPAGGFSSDRLRLEVQGEADLEDLGFRAGVQTLKLRGRRGKSQREVKVLAYFDERLIAEQTLPVFIDAANTRAGVELSGGTCASARGTGTGQGSGRWAGLLALMALVRWGRRRPVRAS